MSTPVRDAKVVIRPYEDADLGSVVDLMRVALGDGPGTGRTPEFFTWKHLANPFGRSYLLVAEADDRIVGLRAFLRWRFRTGDEVVTAVRAVDTATHSEFRRMGIFSRLTRRALDDLRADTDLVFNTPNGRSGPGYLKMGWREVGRPPVRLRIRRPLAVLARAIRRGSGTPPSPISSDAEPASTALRESAGLSALLAEAEGSDGLSTDRDPAFLRWRYGDVPGLDYRVLREERGGELRGLAVVGLRPRGGLTQGTLVELIAAPGDRQTLRSLIRGAAAAAPFHYVACSFPSGSPEARVAGARFPVPSPRKPTLVVNPLREGLAPDPGDLRSWALTLGDLEVF